jgi:hypothetical protein
MAKRLYAYIFRAEGTVTFQAGVHLHLSLRDQSSYGLVRLPTIALAASDALENGSGGNRW